jgi:formiminotetrahydrofolate cyclodeaminase
MDYAEQLKSVSNGNPFTFTEYSRLKRKQPKVELSQKQNLKRALERTAHLLKLIHERTEAFLLLNPCIGMP